MRTLLSAIGAAAWLLAFAAAAPAGAQTPGFGPETLRQARDGCEAAAAGQLGASASVASAAGALRDLAGNGACRGVVPRPPPTLPVLLDAADADIADRHAAWGCAAAAARPECAGLADAARRLADLRLFERGEVVAISTLGQERYSRGRYHWDRERLSFGQTPGSGISLLRLVLDAAAPDTSLQRRVQAGTWWDEVSAEVTSQTSPTCIAACTVSVSRIIALFPLFDTLDAGFQLATTGNFDRAIKQLEGVVGRWEAYHFGGGKGRAQLPWEIVLNSYAYSRQNQDRIWREPPNSAWTLLHPTVGLAMKDDGGGAVVLNVVELVGYSRWQYDEETYSRTNEWGVSAIANYRPRDDGQDWGYGALLRTPLNLGGAPVNLAWSRARLRGGGHDDLFAISFDVAKLVPRIDAKCISKLPSCVGKR